MTQQTTTLDLIHDTYNGQIMPYDVTWERRISQRNTINWWRRAHDDRTPYHDRFTGYCPHC